MTRLTTTLIMAVAASALCAAPAMAQSSYNGGDARNQQAHKVKKAKKLKKADDKRMEVLKKREQMEKEHSMKDGAKKGDAMKHDAMKAEKMAPAATYGSGKTYGSATPAKPHVAPMKDTMTGTMKDKATYGSASSASSMTSGSMKTDSMTSGSMKPTNCPSGTEPQNDGTCMLKSGSLLGN